MNYGARLFRRLLFFGMALVVMGGGLGSLVAIESNKQVYESTSRAPAQTIEPFPLGVDPRQATITEQVLVDEFYESNLAQSDKDNRSWWNRLAVELQTKYVWQQMASPVSRIIVVWPGQRTEEIAKNIGDVLRWNKDQRDTFVELAKDLEPTLEEGGIMPGRYVTHRQATPEDINTMLENIYIQDIKSRYTEDIEAIVPFNDALTIASLIEREASDFENMREVSGVIWNRLFIDMALQLDASLQYVKAEDPSEPAWWPVVRPADKFLDSPYNTYQNKGLPPGPIANPSIEAIVAALNPRVTDCLYYFHGKTRDYYCSVTYEEHVRKLRQVYGQGS